MARYSIEDTTLSNIANAIREKTGSTESIKINEMSTEISNIQSSSGSQDIKTCTLNIINYTDDYLKNITYVEYTENSGMVCKIHATIYDGSVATLQNVLVNSIVVFEEYTSAYTSSNSFTPANSVTIVNPQNHYGVHAFYINETADVITLTVE